MSSTDNLPCLPKVLHFVGSCLVALPAFRKPLLPGRAAWEGLSVVAFANGNARAASGSAFEARAVRRAREVQR